MGFPREAKEQDSSPHMAWTLKTRSEISARSSTCRTATALPCDGQNPRRRRHKNLGHVYRRKITAKPSPLRQQPCSSKPPTPPFRCRRPVTRVYPELQEGAVKTSRLVLTRTVSLPSSVGPLSSYNITINASSRCRSANGEFCRGTLKEIGSLQRPEHLDAAQ